jgi:sugar lactone lactonase YvrE
MKKVLAIASVTVAILAMSFALPFTVAVAAESPLTITTFAGPVEPSGAIDGTGSAARFYNPKGVAVDAVGNVYVADTDNSTIRKVTPAGVVTTLAGLAGNAGSVDGAGSAARFYNPRGVAVDAAGNVYVADTFNQTIRKVTPAGVVTTLAGLAWNAGSTDGTGSAARFYNPGAVAVDAAGNVYVSEDNHTIRKITPAGVVTTLAGLAGNSGSTDGTGSAARFKNPRAVAVDAGGNVYVGDYFNHTIRKITPAGVVTTMAGLAGNLGSTDGTGSAARFQHPDGVAVDAAGNVYVADTTNHTIRKITPASVVTTLAGLAGNIGNVDGTGSAARFNYPRAVAVDVGGNVYVVDAASHTIRKVTPAGVVTTLAGSAGGIGSTDGTGDAARFSSPNGVAVDAGGNVYVGDHVNHTIRKISPAGVVTTLAGLAGNAGSTDGTGSAARFNLPRGVAVDAVGNVYVADYFSSTIRKITPAGVVTTLAGSPGNTGSVDGAGSVARFCYPRGVAVDTGGNVYVADSANHTIRKITPAGAVTTLAGLAGNIGSGDGTGSAAQFSHPDDVAVDAVGNVYVADTGNSMVRKITPAGMVTKLAGLAGSSGSTDGTGNAARFYSPRGVGADAVGNVYVADTYNHTIRKISPAGVVTTLAGSAVNAGSTDGTGSAARFYQPRGVAIDAVGNVYVADTENHAIRKGVGNLDDQATIDQVAGAIDEQRQLDTSPQTAVSWQWSVIRRPAGSTVDFSAATVRNPPFTPDVADLFVFRLVATDASGKVSITTVSLTATNNAIPVADAVVDSPGSTVDVGTLVTLSGSASYDPDSSPDGGALTYSWAQTAGSGVSLDQPDDIHPQFTPTVADVYTFKLTVNDGGDDSTDASSPDNTVTVTVNAVVPPVPPTIVLDPIALLPSCVQGNDASFQSFTISNSGSNTLNYAIADDAVWLFCSVVSGDATTETDSVIVAYDTNGLAVGTYLATITISDGAATNNPQTIDVTLTVNKKKSGGGGGGGCSLTATGSGFGWALPYLLLAGIWAASRWPLRRKKVDC